MGQRFSEQRLLVVELAEQLGLGSVSLIDDSVGFHLHSICCNLQPVPQKVRMNALYRLLTLGGMVAIIGRGNQL